MNDVVGRIVDVKELRVERAEEAVRQHRLELEEAARQVVERKRELEDYHDWRVRKETQLYDDIEEQLVSLRELEDLKLEIGLLRGRETLFMQKIDDAERARVTAHTALETSTRTYEAAQRNLQKFEELADWLDAEARAYRERMEESELEEQLTMAAGNREETFA